MRKCTKLSDNQEPLVVESKITEADVAQDYIIKRFSQFHELHTQVSFALSNIYSILLTFGHRYERSTVGRYPIWHLELFSEML